MCHIHKDQIEGDIWTIPAENMKGRRDATTEFRVPLSTEVLEILKQARLLSRNDFFFLQEVVVPLLMAVCHITLDGYFLNIISKVLIYNDSLPLAF
ncbi:hypothetical protein GCM10023261_09210 [Bartonella jaculi]|uniref:Uncharacterized protein n=1 Tax=Bartonella jaculi TaxID=686226 RepID=A0ABP9N5M3_9HYPH